MERRERVIINWNFVPLLKVENTSGKLPEGRATMNCESVYGLEFWEL